MKKTFVAAVAAAAMFSAAPSFADEATPTMSLDMVTQGTVAGTDEANALVPALFIMFLLLGISGGSGIPACS